MSGENERLTEAELQIERLKRLKAEKEIKEKNAKEMAFMEPEKLPKTEEKPAIDAAHAVRKHKPGAKVLRTARIEKTNFDRLHTLVNAVNKGAGKNRTNKDKVINLLIKRLLDITEGDQGITRESLETIIAELGKK